MEFQTESQKNEKETANKVCLRRKGLGLAWSRPGDVTFNSMLAFGVSILLLCWVHQLANNISRCVMCIFLTGKGILFSLAVFVFAGLS